MGEEREKLFLGHFSQGAARGLALRWAILGRPFRTLRWRVAGFGVRRLGCALGLRDMSLSGKAVVMCPSCGCPVRSTWSE